MRWNVFLVFDDAAMPKPGPDGQFWSATVDCSGDDHDQLVDRAYDAARALLKDRVDELDMEINLIAAERFPNANWIGELKTCNDAWRRTLDAELPALAGSSPSAIWTRVAGNPGEREVLEREWTGAAAKALAATGGVDCAYELLGGVRSLKRGLLPGARCFNDFNDDPAVYDCRNYVIEAIRAGRKKPAGGKIVIVEIERRG